MEKKKTPGRRRKRSRRRRKRIVVIAVLALVCVLLIFGCGQRLVRYERVSEDIAATERALAAAKAERIALADQKTLLEDEAYLRILARKKLGYICRGETIYLPAAVCPEALPSVNTQGVIAE